MALRIGIDEVGTGAWAGPILLCAFQAEEDWHIEGLADSKSLSAGQREKLAVKLRRMTYATGEASSREIDLFGVRASYNLALLRVLHTFEQRHGALADSTPILFDGDPFEFKSRFRKSITFIPKGDKTVSVIMAASIIAKVRRDEMMVDFADQYPHWDFEQNKGYGVPAHAALIEHHGICEIHRRSVAPIQAFLLRKAG